MYKSLVAFLRINTDFNPLKL